MSYLFQSKITKFQVFFLVIFIFVLFWSFLFKSVRADCCRCYSSRINQCFCYDYKPPNEQCKCEDPFESQSFTRDCKDVGQCKDCQSVGSSEEFGKLLREEEKETPVVVPKLQVEIPGFKGFSKEVEICLEEGKSLEECEKSQRAYAIPWIGEYIVALYKWSVGAIAIIAVIMIIIGGFQWLMAGGNVSNISNAKSRITYAVVGLILILGSNLVLSSINPNLTIFKPLVLGKIERIELNGELSDNGVADLVSSGIYFKQCDEKWGNMAYTEGGSGCNLCSSGCGPTAMAIVLSSKGINVTPADIGQWAIEVGARKDCSGGTNLSLLTQKIGEKWSGVKGEIITNFDKAMDYLNNGSWLIVSIRKVPVPGHCLNSKCGKEICFCGGHFVVAAGKTGDTIHIIDPSRVGINSLTVSQLKNYLSTGNFYHIWK